MINGKWGKGERRKERGKGEWGERASASASESKRERERERRFYARGAPKLTFSAGEKPPWIPRALPNLRAKSACSRRLAPLPLYSPHHPFPSRALPASSSSPSFIYIRYTLSSYGRPRVLLQSISREQEICLNVRERRVSTLTTIHVANAAQVRIF